MRRSTRFSSPQKRRKAREAEDKSLSFDTFEGMGWDKSADLGGLADGKAFEATANVRPSSNSVHIGKGINIGGYEVRDRKKHHRFNAPTTPQTILADKLIDILINAKKDIERVKSCESIEGAKKYAEQHDLYFYNGKEEAVDVNGDGVPEIILVNRRGEPIVVNGHRLKPSKFPFKLEYNQLSDEERGKYYGYKDWVECGAYEADDEFDDNGNREVRYSSKNLPSNWKALKDAGYRPPAAPRKKLTARQQITSELSACFNVFWDNIPNLRDHQWMKGILPRMKIITMAYINLIDRFVILNMNETQRAKIITAGGGDIMKTWELYCDFKRESKDDLNNYLLTHKAGILASIESNFGSTFMAIFNQMGVPALVAKSPSDDDMKYEDDRDNMSQIKAQKSEYKAELNIAADKAKETLISDIIAPLLAE